MARSITFVFPLPAGLHARPASALEAAVRPWKAGVRFVRSSAGREADARSVLQLIATETAAGERCELRIEGEDESAAEAALATFLRDILPHVDAATEPVPAAVGSRAESGQFPGTGLEKAQPGAPTQLPRSLLAAGVAEALTALPGPRGSGAMIALSGQAVSEGIGWAPLVILTRASARGAAISAKSSRSPSAETEAFEAARRAVTADLEKEIAALAGKKGDPRIEEERPSSLSPQLRGSPLGSRARDDTAQGRSTHGANSAAGEILRSHLSILRDPALGQEVQAGIAQGLSARDAVVDAGDTLSAPLRAAASDRVRERALDIQDVVDRICEKLDDGGGDSSAGAQAALVLPSVVAAAALTPRQLLSFDRGLLQGLLLGAAGATSHAAILARSFGIPTVAGLGTALSNLRAGDDVIVDGNLGLVVVRPAEAVQRFYRRQQGNVSLLRSRLTAAVQATAGAEVRSSIEIGANISSAAEAAAAIAQGAQGIGLFRTEMLFLGRADAPSEDEQYETYAAAVRACAGRPLIIRALDAGGDKPLPFLPLAAEANPFLGVRGVRWYAQFPDIVRAQFRALLRAAAHGPLRIMIPMVSDASEMRLCRRLLDEARAGELQPPVELGAMLEVPSALFALDALCAEADFFSIGTNDLAQYLFAADRENPSVSDPGRPFHPAFLRALKLLADGAKRHRRWIGLCGEWGEQAGALPLLVGLGLDEVSVAAPAVGRLRAESARLDPAACGALLEQALALNSAAAVQAAVREHAAAAASRAAASAPLVAPELIILDSDSRTKEETIREMADLLHLTGRTGRPDRIEAAVWQREQSCSTGFGDGFALPHCKSDELAANSMVVIRLRQPVAWQSLDDRPVDIAVLLAIRTDHSRDHLAALGRFSRLLARAEFRERLRGETDPVRLAAAIAAGCSG